MGAIFASGLLGGVTAAVIWTSVCLMAGMETKTIGLWALIFLVGCTAISTLIGSLVAKNKAAQGSS